MLGTNLVLLVTSCIVSRWEWPGDKGEGPGNEGEGPGNQVEGVLLGTSLILTDFFCTPNCAIYCWHCLLTTPSLPSVPAWLVAGPGPVEAAAAELAGAVDDKQAMAPSPPSQKMPHSQTGGGCGCEVQTWVGPVD